MLYTFYVVKCLGEQISLVEGGVFKILHVTKDQLKEVYKILHADEMSEKEYLYLLETHIGTTERLWEGCDFHLALEQVLFNDAIERNIFDKENT